MLKGPRRSGKGTIHRVITALLGPENVCNPALADFAKEFGMQPLIGKRAAIVPDALLSNKPTAKLSPPTSSRSPARTVSPSTGRTWRIGMVACKLGSS